MSKANRNKPKRSVASDSLYALFEFERDFPDDAACLDYIFRKRYPNGVFCAVCKRVTKHHRDKQRPSYACQFCGIHVHPMVGTIFQDSATSLRLWFYAIYLMASTRCGISAKQIERELGVTYKTAWRMFNRIRSLMGDMGQLGGTVEIDETYIGPHQEKRGRPVRGSNRVPVLGMVERGKDGKKGRVLASVVPDVTRSTIVAEVKAKILPKSVVYTDEYSSYDPVRRLGYEHKRIPHTQKVYVAGDVHTNSVEGFWALVKRGISGVYHGVSTKWLQAYLDEYTFRYNNRGNPRGIFTEILSRAVPEASS